MTLLYHHHYFYHESKSIFDSFPGWISAIASVITVVIAYQIFKNQDAKKVIVKLHLKKVLQLKNDFENSYLSTMKHDEEKETKPEFAHLAASIDLIYLYNFELMEKNKDDYSSYFKNFPLFFHPRFFLTSPLFRYTTDYTIPKNIRTEISNLISLDLVEEVKEQFEDKSYIFINYFVMPNVKYVEEPKAARSLQHKKIKTFEEFHAQVLKIKSEIHSFFRKFDIEN
jgi:hypothetical protein